MVLPEQPVIMLNRVLLCPALGEFGIRSWIAVPPLFLCAATGVAAAGAHVVGDGAWLTVSAPLLFGFAAALALFTGFRARWRRPWRLLLRGAYPVLLVGCALAFDHIRVPVVPALLVGVVTLGLLGLVLARGSRRPAHCGEQ